MRTNAKEKKEKKQSIKMFAMSIIVLDRTAALPDSIYMSVSPPDTYAGSWYIET